MMVNILMASRNSSRMLPQLYKEGHPKVQLCDNKFAFSTALSPPQKNCFFILVILVLKWHVVMTQGEQRHIPTHFLSRDICFFVAVKV